MAKFLKKMTGSEKKQKKEKQETKQENIETADQEQDLSQRPSSSERAKAELEKRIAEKLSRMSDTDLEALFNLHQQQLLAKKNEARNSVGRRGSAVMEGQISFVDVKEESVELQPEINKVIEFEPRPAPKVDLFETIEPEPVYEEEILAFEDIEPEELFEPEPEAILDFESELEPEALLDLESEPESDLLFELESESEAMLDLEPELEPAISAASGEESKFQIFKEKFAVYFDQFASGAMLEAGNHKMKAAYGKIAQRRSAAGAKVSLSLAKTSVAFKKKMRKRGSPLAAIFKKIKISEKRARVTKCVLLNYKRNVLRSEKKASLYMASFITTIDKGNDKLTETTVKMAKKSNKRVNFAREWADLNKKKLLACLVVIISCAVSYVSVTNYFTAYVYAYNGKALGMVKHQEDVLRILDIVSEQLSKGHGTQIEINRDQNITFERVVSTSVNREIDDMQEVFNRLTYMQDMNAKAYAFFIDGRRIAILDTEERAQGLLRAFRDTFLYQEGSAPTQYESISFAERIDIRQIDTQLGRLDNADDILDKIKEGTVQEKIHVVQRGQTFSGIARQHGMSMSELEAMNPGITPSRLSVEQEIILQHAVPLLTVQTVEVATYPDILAYETIYEDSPNIFKGEQTTRIRGINGEREVTARIIRNNGVEVEREELSQVILKEASSAVVLRGTKEPPPLQGTGTLRNPLSSSYRLTSRFGMRGGRMHYGIDMATRAGTPIRAADGGTVIFAGYRGSFGNLVIIDHGNRVQTYYAHCSRLLVRTGEKVHQQQHIANVGSTGRSSGAHLHFEVHVNGVARNPLNYI